MGEIVKPIDPNQISKEQKNLTQKKLETLKLTPDSLQGRSVLDLHGGNKTLAEKDPSYGTTQLRDFDPRDSEDGDLPYEEEQFDLVLATDGILQGDPDIANVMYMYQESLRILKPGGEIRIAHPFRGYERPENTPADWKPEEELLRNFDLFDIDRETITITHQENPQNPSLIITKKDKQHEYL